MTGRAEMLGWKGLNIKSEGAQVLLSWARVGSRRCTYGSKIGDIVRVQYTRTDGLMSLGDRPTVENDI